MIDVSSVITEIAEVVTVVALIGAAVFMVKVLIWSYWMIQDVLYFGSVKDAFKHRFDL